MAVPGTRIFVSIFSRFIGRGRWRSSSAYGKPDVLDGTSDDDVISSDGNLDELYGLDGDDVLDGGTDNDVLVGGPGADTLQGEEGTDTANYFHSASGVTVDLAAGTGTGGDAQGDTLTGIEYVIGSDPGDDALSGTAGADILAGGAVTICCAAGPAPTVWGAGAVTTCSAAGPAPTAWRAGTGRTPRPMPTAPRG